MDEAGLEDRYRDPIGGMAQAVLALTAVKASRLWKLSAAL